MLDHSNLASLVSDAGRKTAILDANLLILWISSKLSLESPLQFKRVKEYSVEDIQLLRVLLSRFRGVATTAYVLAETSNLANELSGKVRDAWFRELASFAVVTAEAHVPTATIGRQSETVRFGVADSALSFLSSDYTLITSEFKLANYLQDQGRQVVNFSQLRLAVILR